MPSIGPNLLWFISSLLVFGFVCLFYMCFVQNQFCKKNWPSRFNFSRVGSNHRIPRLR